MKSNKRSIFPGTWYQALGEEIYYKEIQVGVFPYTYLREPHNYICLSKPYGDITYIGYESLDITNLLKDRLGDIRVLLKNKTISKPTTKFAQCEIYSRTVDFIVEHFSVLSVEYLEFLKDLIAIDEKYLKLLGYKDEDLYKLNDENEMFVTFKTDWEKEEEFLKYNYRYNRKLLSLCDEEVLEIYMYDKDSTLFTESQKESFLWKTREKVIGDNDPEKKYYMSIGTKNSDTVIIKYYPTDMVISDDAKIKKILDDRVKDINKLCKSMDNYFSVKKFLKEIIAIDKKHLDSLGYGDFDSLYDRWSYDIKCETKYVEEEKFLLDSYEVNGKKLRELDK